MAEENQQEHGKPATMGQVKSLIRRKLRRHPPHEEMSLNIYPMIDMMTILLVFLIMQFANSTSSKVTESEELQLPYTMSRNAVDNAHEVEIFPTENMSAEMVAKLQAMLREAPNYVGFAD